MNKFTPFEDYITINDFCIRAGGDRHSWGLGFKSNVPWIFWENAECFSENLPMLFSIFELISDALLMYAALDSPLLLLYIHKNHKGMILPHVLTEYEDSSWTSGQSSFHIPCKHALFSSEQLWCEFQCYSYVLLSSCNVDNRWIWHFHVPMKIQHLPLIHYLIFH